MNTALPASNLIAAEVFSVRDEMAAQAKARVRGFLATAWASTVALVLLTLWILTKGFRIITGRTQLPMMALVGDALRAGLIIGIAVAAAGASSTIYWSMTDGTSSAISKLVSDNPSPYDSIDKNLAYVQLMLTAIDAVSAGMNGGFNAETGDAKDRAKWFTGIGIAGPGVVAGSALLLNKIAIALFVGLGPLFILCLLFEQTKSLFSRWLFYGIGTLFSLAVLSVMVELSTRMVGAVAISILGKYAALATASSLTDSLGLGDISSALTSAMGGNDGITSMAMQQGGLGLVLSTLIISAPPMAASFFQGTLGSFAAQNSFGYLGSQGQGARQQAAAAGQPPPAPVDPGTQAPNPGSSVPTRGLGGQGTTSTVGAHSDTIGTAPVPQAR
jgi:type IV secretion system protein VirB6